MPARSYEAGAGRAAETVRRRPAGVSRRAPRTARATGFDPLPACRTAACRELLADGGGGGVVVVGYFLEESVFDADQFIDALERVASGGTAMDPVVITKVLSSGSSNRCLEALTKREHDVLSLMAEGLSNHAIGQRLFLSQGAISKYTTLIFGKLGITDNDNHNRRVLAVLTYLNKP